MCGALALADGSTWLVFDGEGCQFTYDTGLHVRRLHRELRGRYVPVSAVRRVDYTPPGQGRRRGSLRLVLHPGVDPILAVIGEERADSLYPYQVEVDRANHPTARRLRELIAEAVKASPPNHRAGFLLPGPELPCRLRGVDGVAEFDGHAVRFTWRWASAAKSAAGPTRTVPLSVIDGVEWVDGSHAGRGGLRIRVAGSDGACPGADFGDDHNALVVSAFAEASSVLFAAAVLEAVARRPTRITRPAEPPGAADSTFVGGVLQDGADVGSFRVHRLDGTPKVVEIDELVGPGSPGGPPDSDGAEPLVAAALRWASTSGAVAVTWWVSDWPEQRGAYERQGFDLVGKWRSTDPGEQWQLRATLLPEPGVGQEELLGVLGSVAPRRPSWPYVLGSLGATLAAGLGALTVLAVVLAFVPRVQPRDWAGLGTVWSVIVVAVLAALTWPFVRAGVRASALSRAKTAAALLRRDRRAPVLYLRSFPDDAATRRPVRLGSLVTEEQAVATVVADVGPFIGLGRAVRVVGAARGEVSHAAWRPAIGWLLAHARLVVLRCGTGESLLWELAQAVTILRPDQLLILVPKDGDLYRDFRGRAAAVLPEPLPPLQISGHAPHRLAAAIHFGPGWHPRVISLHEPLALRILALDSWLAVRLGTVLRQFGVRRTRFWLRRLWVLCFLTLQVFFIVRIGLHIAALNQLKPW